MTILSFIHIWDIDFWKPKIGTPTYVLFILLISMVDWIVYFLYNIDYNLWSKKEMLFWFLKNKPWLPWLVKTYSKSQKAQCFIDGRSQSVFEWLWYFYYLHLHLLVLALLVLLVLLLYSEQRQICNKTTIKLWNEDMEGCLHQPGKK